MHVQTKLGATNCEYIVEGCGSTAGGVWQYCWRGVAMLIEGRGSAAGGCDSRLSYSAAAKPLTSMTQTSAHWLLATLTHQQVRM